MNKAVSDRTITIYDLLKLVHNDEAPQMIKYNNSIYTYGWGDYMGDEPLTEYYRNGDGLGLFCQDNITLDTKVFVMIKYKNSRGEQSLDNGSEI